MLLSEEIENKISAFYGKKIDSCNNENTDYRDTSQVEKWLLSFVGGMQQTLYIKQYRPDYFPNYAEVCNRELEAASKYRGGFTQNAGFNVVVPIIALPEKGILVSEEALGEDVYSVTLSLKNRLFHQDLLKKMYFLSGEGMRLFHDKSRKSQPFQYIDYQAYLDVRFSKLRELESTLFSADDESVIRSFITKTGEALDGCAMECADLHGDYIPPNLIYQPETIHLLDFSQFREGSIIDEVCYFFVFCEMQTGIFGDGIWPNLAQEFYNGYTLTLAKKDVPFVHLYYLKHMMNSLLRTSYWFRSTESSRVKNRYNKWKYKVLRQNILKYCSETSPYQANVGGIELSVGE